MRHHAKVLWDLLSIFIVPVLFTSVAAQQLPAAQSDAFPRPSVPGPLLIGAGDLLHVSVLGAPDFERDVRVSESGTMALPLVGEVSVGGRTIAAAEREVASALRNGGFFTDPQVSILVKEYATQGISVLGEVQKPGIYPLLGSHTLFDAISAAGGTTAKAGRTVTITHRKEADRPEVAMFTNDPAGPATGNLPVFPGDTIVVSKAGIVYVVGDVKQPTAVVLENPDLTVLQAIAAAQGVNSTASLDKSKLIRKSTSGMQEISVPLKRILAGKQSDIHMQPDDVLFVPQSMGKKVAARSIEAVLQTATGIAIWGH
jgi:polysaccharide export outer membrane protein